MCKGIPGGVFPRTPPQPLGPNSFPGMSSELASGKVASPAAPPSHFFLHNSREYSGASVPALSRIPNGTGIIGDGLSGMLCPASPFPLALPLWKSPSCLLPVFNPVLEQLRAGYLWIHFLLDPNCLLRAEAFGIFGRTSPSREL